MTDANPNEEALSSLEDLLETAWVLICNAGEGNWESQHRDWQAAAARFRERYQAALKAREARRERERLLKCRQCGRPCFDDYMVRDDVWLQTGLGRLEGVLHLGCLEVRLGRPLRADDLTEAPVNGGIRHGMRMRPRPGLGMED